MNLSNNDSSPDKGFPFYAGSRVVLALLSAVCVIWGITVLGDYAQPWTEKVSTTVTGQTETAGDATIPSHNEKPAHPAPVTSHHQPTDVPHQNLSPAVSVVQEPPAPSPADETALQTHQQPDDVSPVAPPGHSAAVSSHAVHNQASVSVPQVTGEAFAEAVIKPMEYELQERFWRWRPNDIVRITDNVNNFQLGTLEVTRRAVVKLAERISRTGSTDTLDKNLEQAMNWFMIKADSFWFPAAEKKYKDGLEEIRKYQARLVKGEADFHTRTDNLIPLFKAFADLAGSCDDKLVRAREKNGEAVSTFAADNYFYYAKGVASAMEPMLEAVAVDFREMLLIRGAMETLHHAIHACHQAAQLEPLIVTEADLDGILANHRANMAAHISHARFYLDVLVNTLST